MSNKEWVLKKFSKACVKEIPFDAPSGFVGSFDKYASPSNPCWKFTGKSARNVWTAMAIMARRHKEGFADE